MTRISIFYPQTTGSRFDFRYYTDTHMPLAIRLLSAHPGYRGVSVERGLSYPGSGTIAAYVAMCHFQFESAEAFMAAFAPHAATLQADIPNYTDIAPVIQLSEILLSQ